jgi:hypothetical protein
MAQLYHVKTGIQHTDNIFYGTDYDMDHIFKVISFAVSNINAAI